MSFGPQSAEFALYGRRFRYHGVGPTRLAIDARYTALKHIGKGAYGTVFGAYDTVSRRPVAIKVMRTLFRNLTNSKRIFREMTVLVHLRGHQCITEVLDMWVGPPVESSSVVGCDGFDEVYIVLERFDCDLRSIIYSKQQVLTMGRIRSIMLQVLCGLKCAHAAGILHRDIKPENVLCKGADDKTALCDFGLSRGCEGERLPVPRAYDIVTRWYRAPEILCGGRTYGPASDVWSAGCVLAELLLRSILLPGKDEQDQLQLIVNLLGKPDAATTAKSCGKKGFAMLASVKETRGSFDSRFEAVPEDALDILRQMLQFDPAARISAEDAILHPFFLGEDIDVYTMPVPYRCEWEQEYPGDIPASVLMSKMRTVAEAFKQADADPSDEVAIVSDDDPMLESHEPATVVVDMSPVVEETATSGKLGPLFASIAGHISRLYEAVNVFSARSADVQMSSAPLSRESSVGAQSTEDVLMAADAHGSSHYKKLRTREPDIRQFRAIRRDGGRRAAREVRRMQRMHHRRTKRRWMDRHVARVRG